VISSRADATQDGAKAEAITRISTALNVQFQAYDGFANNAGYQTGLHTRNEGMVGIGYKF
jgi:hypothetical protein